MASPERTLLSAVDTAMVELSVVEIVTESAWLAAVLAAPSRVSTLLVERLYVMEAWLATTELIEDSETPKASS